MGLFRKKSTKTPVVAAVPTDAAPSGISEEPSVAPVSEEEQHPQQPTTDYSADGPTSAVIASSSLPASPGNTGESVATEANAVPVASEGRHDHDGPHSKLLTSLSEENKREYSDRANVAPVVREADANDAGRPAYNEAAEPSSTGDVGTGTEHESGLAAPLIYGEDGIETNQNSHPSHADTAAVGGLAGAGAGVAAGSALHDGQQSQQQQPVADDAMTRGFTPVPTSTGGADVSRSNSTAAAQAPGGSTVSDDGMMRGFTPVPTGPGGGVSSHQPQEKELTAPNTSADQGETNQQRNGLPTAALVGGGLAGIGAGTAYNARSGAGENRDFTGVETSTFSPGPTTAGSNLTPRLPAPINTAAITPVPAGAAPPPGAVPSHLQTDQLADGPNRSSEEHTPISPSALSKIKHGELKDSRKLAKVFKSEAKDEQKQIDFAIKEISSLQKLLRTAQDAEAKSTKHRNEALKLEQKSLKAHLEAKGKWERDLASLNAHEAELEETRKTTAKQTQLLQEQTARVEMLREAKARGERERALFLEESKKK